MSPAQGHQQGSKYPQDGLSSLLCSLLNMQAARLPSDPYNLPRGKINALKKHTTLLLSDDCKDFSRSTCLLKCDPIIHCTVTRGDPIQMRFL